LNTSSSSSSSTTTMTLDEKLWTAVAEGKTWQIAPLIAQGGNVATTRNDPTTFRGDRSSLLHVAARKGHANMVRILLEYGANVDAKNNLGQTAFHVAMAQDRIKIGYVLLDHGADLSISDVNGKAPFDVARSDHMANRIRQHQDRLDQWMGENAALLAFVGSKSRMKLQTLQQNQQATFDVRIKNQKAVLLGSQAESLLTLQKITHALQEQVAKREAEQEQQKKRQQQQEHRPESAILKEKNKKPTVRFEDDGAVVVDVNNNIIIIISSSNSHEEARPPARDTKRRKAKNDDDGIMHQQEVEEAAAAVAAHYLQRVTHCEHQVQEKKVEMAALIRMMQQQHTRACNGDR
jgi:Ankyrin repeats (many copies)